MQLQSSCGFSIPAGISSLLDSLVLVITTFPIILANSPEGFLSSEDVAKLAVNFFQRRRIRSIVIYVCSDYGRRHIMKTLATAGAFETTAPLNPLNHPNLLLHQPVVGVLLWSVCPWSRSVFMKMEEEFSANVHWLLINDDGTVPGDKFRVDTELTIARKRKTDSKIDLMEAFAANPGDEIQMRLLGVWSTGTPSQEADIEETGERSVAVRRLGVNNVKVKAVLYMWKIVGPDVMKKLFGMTREAAMPLLTPLAMHGHIIFMNAVARYNMTVTELIPNLKPGQLAVPRNVPFDGAVGVIERGEADVEPGVVLTPDRARCMVFSITTWKLKTTCGFLSNSALGSSDALLKPFHWTMWAGVTVFSAVVLVLHKYFREVEGIEKLTWSDIVISSIGTFTGQGFLACGEWISCRALLLLFEIFFYLCQAYYGASIVNFLLRPPSSTIRTMHDLVRSNYRGAAHDWIHTRRVLQNSTDPLVHEVYVRKVQRPQGLGFLSTKDALLSLATPWTAFFGSDDVLYEAASKLTDTEVCRFLELDVDTPLFIALGTRTNAPFKEWMHSATLLQVERGIAYREQKAWHQRRPECGGGGGTSGDDLSVTLSPILPILVVLVFGCVVALAVLFVERRAFQRSEYGHPHLAEKHHSTYRTSRRSDFLVGNDDGAA